MSTARAAFTEMRMQRTVQSARSARSDDTSVNQQNTAEPAVDAPWENEDEVDEEAIQRQQRVAHIKVSKGRRPHPRRPLASHLVSRIAW